MCPVIRCHPNLGGLSHAAFKDKRSLPQAEGTSVQRHSLMNMQWGGFQKRWKHLPGVVLQKVLSPAQSPEQLTDSWRLPACL